MESDSVRTMGESTLVDLWIEGKFRAITVSRQAIEGALRLPPNGPALSDDERREFVRTHLTLIVRAAAARLRADPAAETIVIDGGQLGGEPPRQTGDRRKGERRKANLGGPGGIERRRG